MWVKVALCKSNDSSSVPGFHLRSLIQVIPTFPQEERRGWVIHSEACEPASLKYALHQENNKDSVSAGKRELAPPSCSLAPHMCWMLTCTQ